MNDADLLLLSRDSAIPPPHPFVDMVLMCMVPSCHIHHLSWVVAHKLSCLLQAESGPGGAGGHHQAGAEPDAAHHPRSRCDRWGAHRHPAGPKRPPGPQTCRQPPAGPHSCRRPVWSPHGDCHIRWEPNPLPPPPPSLPWVGVFSLGHVAGIHPLAA